MPYRTARNKVNKMKKKAKVNYFNSKFTEYSSNSKKTWTLINSIISKKSKSLAESFIIDNCLVVDKNIIANKFNSHFANAGLQLAETLPETQLNFRNFLPERIINSMFLTPVTSDELTKLVHSLSNTSAGYDDVPISLLKHVINLICNILVDIFNKSFTSGIFPDSLKIAKLTPVHKKDNKQLIENYRPIAVLSSFSKLLEKLMCNRLNNFLKQNAVISESQFGFRESRGTPSAILKLNEHVLKNFDSKKITAAVFLDLSKAFETINHKILLHKLEHFGIRGNVLQWFSSYLKNRSQFVNFNGVKSDSAILNISVPQGSVLGPSLFNLYINDLTRSSNRLNYILFADDSTVYFSADNMKVITDTLNQELDRVYEWTVANKLTINFKKTNYIVFNRNRTLDLVNHDPIRISNKTIEEAQKTTFLGVIVQKDLKWNSHIQFISAKINKKCGILYLIRDLMPKNILIDLYYSIVYPHILYCNIIWGNT